MKLAIVHFRPLEYYPPVHNLIRYLSENTPDFIIEVYTTNNHSGLKKISYEAPAIHRMVTIMPQQAKWIRFLKYFYFNLYTFFSILLNKPDRLIYFETISSFPVFLIKRFFYRKMPIFIHYHEYTSPQQYQTAMFLERFFHHREPYLYKKAKWISHTNPDRLSLFANDHKEIDFTGKLFDLPNFPPQRWHKSTRKALNKSKSSLKLVYVGSLSLKNMYAKELFDWIHQQEGKVRLDVFSINIRKEVLDYLKKINCTDIHFKGGVAYDDLPNVLPDYHVGLVLYNGNSLNFTYNAPNKLFEYLACDLDVWFSSDLISSYPYINTQTYPKTIKVDFKALPSFNWKKAVDRKGLPHHPTEYFCERVLTKLVDQLSP